MQHRRGPKGKTTTLARETYHHGDLRAALLRAAVKLIESHGISGFAMKEAAAAASVVASAPYRHFADKESLLAAIAVEGFEELHARLAAARGSLSGLAQVESLALAYARFASERPAHFRVMFEAGLDKTKHQELAVAGEPAFGVLAQTVSALLGKAGERKRAVLAAGLWALIHGFAVLEGDPAFASLSAAAPRDELLRGAIRRFLSGT